jgi:hypothetical protein
MGYDYERNQFTPDTHEMLEAQLMPLAEEMEPGDVCFVEENDIIIDDSSSKAMWIDRYARILTEEDVSDGLLDACMNEEDLPLYVRLIRVNQGLVADYSHLDQRVWAGAENRFARLDAPRVRRHPEDFLPIIYAVFNESELEVIAPALADNNIDLTETNLNDMVTITIGVANEIYEEEDEDSDDSDGLEPEEA